jgi:hypothetical protein
MAPSYSTTKRTPTSNPIGRYFQDLIDDNDLYCVLHTLITSRLFKRLLRSQGSLFLIFLFIIVLVDVNVYAPWIFMEWLLCVRYYGGMS